MAIPFVVWVAASTGLFNRGSGHATGFPLQGRYTVVNIVRPQSLQVVALDVYTGFACEPCQEFHADRRNLAQRYGARLTIRQHFVVLDAAAPNEPLRLYLASIASARAPEVADALMAASLDPRDRAAVRVQTARIAAHFGLQTEYQNALTDVAMTARIERGRAAAGFVRQIPAVVVNSNILVPTDIDNLGFVIDSLLSPADLGPRVK